MHKDLSEGWSGRVDYAAYSLAFDLFGENQSLALAREAWINAFDKAAEELDGGDNGQTQA